jgi:hypothetical protein
MDRRPAEIARLEAEITELARIDVALVDKDTTATHDGETSPEELLLITISNHPAPAQL